MSDFLNEELAQQETEPARPTREQRAAEAATQIKQSAVSSTRAFVDAINSAFDLVWNNPYGLTPGEVAEALGADALAVFSRHAATAQFLISQASSLANVIKTVPEGYAISYEMAEDGVTPTGRVTITEPE